MTVASSLKIVLLLLLLFEESLLEFRKARGYPENVIELSDISFRQSALKRKKSGTEIAFCHNVPSSKSIKRLMMEHWSLIHNQPLLKTVFKKSLVIWPVITCGRSFAECSFPVHKNWKLFVWHLFTINLPFFLFVQYLQ